MSDDYPRFFPAIVGVAPNTMKTFTAEDVAMLVAMFNVATGVDALTATRPLADIVKETVEAGFTA